MAPAGRVVLEVARAPVVRGPALVFVPPVAVTDLVPPRDVAVAALRGEPVAVFVAGRVPGRAGVAIAPVIPRRTWFFFAPALASGSGLPADRAACATVVTAARKAPLIPDVARSSAPAVDLVERVPRPAAVLVVFRVRAIPCS